MENQNNISTYYWLLPIQAIPGVVLLFLLNPLEYLDTYGKVLGSLQLLVSCATIPIIVSFKHFSFRIWVISAILIPLPILIFTERLYFESFLISQYYFFLLLFFGLNYYLRNLKIFIPILFISFLGPVFIWGITEMFSDIENIAFFYMSPILNFFLSFSDKISSSVFFMLVVSALGYIVLLINKYLVKAKL